MARITRIVLYPIKSLDGISVGEARVSSQGALENDRRYAIVDTLRERQATRRHAPPARAMTDWSAGRTW